MTGPLSMAGRVGPGTAVHLQRYPAQRVLIGPIPLAVAQLVEPLRDLSTPGAWRVLESAGAHF